MTRGRVLLAIVVSLLVSQRGVADQCAQNKTMFMKIVEDLSKKNIDAEHARILIRQAIDKATDEAGTICGEAAKELINRIKDDRRLGLPYYVTILGDIQNLGEHEDNVVTVLCPLLRDPSNIDVRKKSAMALVRKYASPTNKNTAITKLGAAKVDETDLATAKAFQNAIKAIHGANSDGTATITATIAVIAAIIAAVVGSGILRDRKKHRRSHAGTSRAAWFFRASTRKERLLAFMHRDVNHSLRDLVWKVDQVENDRVLTKDPIRAVEDLTNDFLMTLLERVAEEATELAGHKCCVSLHVPVKCGPHIDKLDSQDASAAVRVRYAKMMGGEGTECLSNSVNRARILVWARKRSLNRDPLRNKTSFGYWFLSNSTAHAHFEGQRDRAVYCPAYDLGTLSTEEGCRAVADRGDTVFCFPKRPEFWLNYRSVAVFPIRGRPFATSQRRSIVGYLWIDSMQPRAFKHMWENQGTPPEWGPAMHFIQAITDALATALTHETFTRRRLKQRELTVPPARGPTVPPAQGPTVPPTQGPTVQQGHGPGQMDKLD